MRKVLVYFAPVALVAASVFSFAACANKTDRSGFGEGQPKDPNGQPPLVNGQVPCTGLECKVVDCAAEGGEPTTLTGRVYDPAGANPLYNVMVYIPGGGDPDGPLPEIADSTKDGIACETCSSIALNPLRSALTNAKGEFTLENVPVEKDVPVVIQIGKWRRKVHLDITKKCEENRISDSESKQTIRLPRNGSEGDMPQIAVTSGSCDALECMLRGIGIDDKEFVSGADPSGHVHVYAGSGGKMGKSAQTELWNDAEILKKYDIVLLSCECSEHQENKGGTVPGARASMYDYLNAGGRVFATHYHYTWFKDSPHADFQNIAEFQDEYTSLDGDYDVNTSFPKGEQMANWLKETGASSTIGKVPLKAVRSSVKQLHDPGISWIQRSGDGTKFFSFNTPITAEPDAQCGRAVFSDLHITDASGPTSIGSCPISAGGLNGQQKALEYLFFDLSACVMDDTKQPEPPK